MHVVGLSTGWGRSGLGSWIRGCGRLRARLPPNWRIILWLALEDGNGGRARKWLFVLERHVHIILDHFSNSHPISNSQWGFQPGKFTVTALLATVDNWLRMLDEGIEIGGLFRPMKGVWLSSPQSSYAKLQQTGLNISVLYADDRMIFQALISGYNRTSLPLILPNASTWWYLEKKAYSFWSFIHWGYTPGTGGMFWISWCDTW